MKATPPIETEIKLNAGTAGSARGLLRRAGFRVSRRRVFEDNVIFDTPSGRLRKAGTLLRLRRTAGEFLLTYKGRAANGKHKSREEWEATVGDWDAMAAIAERLGFRPAFRYQKYRTEYRLPGGAGVATLDETPIGVFFELEGSPAWIDRTASRLGFRESDYITASYGTLYFEWCKKRRVKPGNMVFEPEPEPRP
jgi:adenylate cyclase class 2